MDEYVKKEDALNALLFEMAGTGYQDRAMSTVRLLTSADVVSATEIFDEVEQIIKELRYNADYTIFNMQRDFIELKKKYIKKELKPL